MKQFIASIFPKKVFQSTAHYLAFGLGLGVIFVMLLQLFAFENFPAVFYAFSGGDLEVVRQNGWLDLAANEGWWSILVAAIIVVLEFLSVLFLLSVPLKKSWRRVAALCAILAPLFWFALSVILILMGVQFVNTGMFGSKITVPALIGSYISLLWLAGAGFCVYRILGYRKA